MVKRKITRENIHVTFNSSLGRVIRMLWSWDCFIWYQTSCLVSLKTISLIWYILIWLRVVILGLILDVLNCLSLLCTCWRLTRMTRDENMKFFLVKGKIDLRLTNCIISFLLFKSRFMKLCPFWLIPTMRLLDFDSLRSFFFFFSF